MGLFNNPENDFKNIQTRNYYKVWQPFMEKYKCEYVCELGVFKGGNFMEMIAHHPKLAVAVDTWNNDGVHSDKDASYAKDQLENQYTEFKNKVSKFPFVKIVRDYTVNASKRFPDNYFDFVYIDADHSTEACYADIIAWYPKVKPGKFLVGHDYKRGFGVPAAVDRFVKEEGLKLMSLSPSTWAVVKR